MQDRKRYERYQPALALLWFFGAGLLLPGLVSAQRPAKPAELDPASRAAQISQSSAAATTPGGKARITGLRFLSSKAYTRVMVDLSQGAKYEVRHLKQDPVSGTPPRIYVDISAASLALTSKGAVPVEDGLLKQIRIGQYSPDVVRVVLDMHSLREHKAFLLPDPYRLVIDVQGQKGLEHSTAKEAPTRQSDEPRKPRAKQKTPSPRASMAPGVRKIVLDPGHGGKDPGAIGVGGRREKDIVLGIAKKLAVKLRKEMGVQVVLTRTDDRFVALEDRMALANAEDADLFISLHMNASPNDAAKGIETYYLDNTTDEAALRLAARENGTSQKNVSDLQFILSDMTQNMKLEDSITLAHRLQGSVVGGMTTAIGDVKDLGVKKAQFFVLVGAHMPSVLVEMFFITNRKEGRTMSRARGQKAMVDALFDGIRKYEQSILIAKTL